MISAHLSEELQTNASGSTMWVHRWDTFDAFRKLVTEKKTDPAGAEKKTGVASP